MFITLLTHIVDMCINIDKYYSIVYNQLRQAKKVGRSKKVMKKTPVAKKKSLKAKKQGFLSRSSNILNSRRQKGRKSLANN